MRGLAVGIFFKNFRRSGTAALAGRSILGLGLLFLGACRPAEEKWSEERDYTYRQGQQLLREGREQDALEKFLEVIRQHPPAPRSQLQCGRIYWETLEDPVFALYHFRQFLKVAPEDARERELVPRWIGALRKMFLKQCHPHSLYRQYANGFPVLLQGLREENARLKQRVLELERPAGGQPDPPEPRDTFRSEPPSARRRFYVVQEGDTLSVISQKVFGDAGHWPAIFEANREQLSQPDQLWVGQRLLLPAE